MVITFSSQDTHITFMSIARILQGRISWIFIDFPLLLPLCLFEEYCEDLFNSSHSQVSLYEGGCNAENRDLCWEWYCFITIWVIITLDKICWASEKTWSASFPWPYSFLCWNLNSANQYFKTAFAFYLATTVFISISSSLWDVKCFLIHQGVTGINTVQSPGHPSENSQEFSIRV